MYGHDVYDRINYYLFVQTSKHFQSIIITDSFNHWIDLMPSSIKKLERLLIINNEINQLIYGVP